jgi:hypothetical protein
MLARPARGTQVSRSEDRAIFVQTLALANSLWDSDLRDLRNPVLVALPLPLEGMLHDSGSSMKHFAILLAGFALSAATLNAQASSNSVPESHRPPPGMCRIWIDGVPATHQPAPTDCATAIRKRPLNARVVFGSDASGNESRFAPVQPKQSNFTPANVPSHEDQNRAAQQQRDEQERQRAAQQQRDAQERQRADAQRQREEQQKRAASHAPPPPPQAPRSQERVVPQPRTRPEKSQRPPSSSFFARRPR